MVKQLFTKRKNTLDPHVGKAIRRNWELYLFMVPALVLTFIFAYIPMYGVLMAFQDVKIGVPMWENEWVWFKHFQRFFNSPWFTTTLKNTLSISLISNALCWPIPLFLALLIYNSTKPGLAKMAQNFSYLPHLLSTVLVISIVRLFCSGDSGLINIMIRKFGGTPINFFGDPDWVYPMYVISDIWASFGYGAIVYLGALSAVDKSLLEAAEIDGAGKLKQIWHIQLPCIIPTIVTMLVLKMGQLFAMGADKMLLIQTDANIMTSEVIATYVYKSGLGGFQYGFATAVGLFQNIVNLTLVILVNKAAKKLTDVSIF